MNTHFVRNKAKGRISKRVFQENKAWQVFRKTNLPPDTHMCVWVSWGKNVRFSENLACFVFLKHPFWDSPFCIITDGFQIQASSKLRYFVPGPNLYESAPFFLNPSFSSNHIGQICQVSEVLGRITRKRGNS